MIAIQKIGKSFMGALNYNLKKLRHPEERLRAELLDTNFTSLDKAQIKREIDWVCGLRPRLNRYVYHTSLNFPQDEHLSNDTLLAIAHDYLEGSGYTNNQYFIFRHHDAGHPHLHLLVNRIKFDGDVVSDSNNYKKSEALLRSIERRYGLTVVTQSNHETQHIDNQTNSHIGIYTDIPINGYTIKQHSNYTNRQTGERSPTKDELEMILRTGKVSGKIILQEKLKKLLSNGQVTNVAQLIREGEKQGISFLFNQASTGRVTGITYFHDGFKAKGQALGNRYKWNELIKNISYEQDRDRQMISLANERTRSRYDGTSIAATGAENRERSQAVRPATQPDIADRSLETQMQQYGRSLETTDTTNSESTMKPGVTGDNASENQPHDSQRDKVNDDAIAPYDFDFDLNFDIADDEDETYRRRRTRRSGR